MDNVLVMGETELQALESTLLNGVQISNYAGEKLLVTVRHLQNLNTRLLDAGRLLVSECRRKDGEGFSLYYGKWGVVDALAALIAEADEAGRE